MMKLLIIFVTFIGTTTALTQVELNELSRKFKYYHSAVRPNAAENFLSNANGSFFNVPTQVHLLASRISNRDFSGDLILITAWIDERLRLRELTERFQFPPEFTPWQPPMLFSPAVTSKYCTLAPLTGLVSCYNTIRQTIDCVAEEWKYPFETFHCTVAIETQGDEVLTISNFYDMRPDAQKMLAPATIEEYPYSGVTFRFRAEWPRALISSYFPTILLICAVFLAQWKRRKVQILVSLAALIGILIMIQLCSQRPYTSTTLMDLWLCSSLIHIVFLVIVDLSLPARRVRYTLMVHVDEAAKNVTQHKIITSAEKEQNGLLGFCSKMLSRISTSSRPSTITSLVTASSGPNPIQRQIISSMLGNRKKAALLLIACSFLLFCFVYTCIVLSIE